MFTKLKRIIKFGWQGFSRNKGLSLQVIFIMIIAVFVLSSLFLFNGVSDFLVKKVRGRVDVSVYFNSDVGEEKILSIKENIKDFSPEIKKVTYISKKQAKQAFLNNHKEENIYRQALDQVGGNPFLPSLEIKASKPAIYSNLSHFLTEGPFQDSIKKVSYYNSDKIINRLYSFTSNIKKGGAIFGVVLMILVVLITFNTIKLTIKELKEEVSTMRLVGADSVFAKGPFLVQGFLYGLVSLVVVDILLIGGVELLSSSVKSWLFGFNLSSYFYSKALICLLYQFIFATILGVGSSWLAVRKYLKV